METNQVDPFELLTKGTDNKYIGVMVKIAITFIENGKLEESKFVLTELMKIL